MVMVARGDDGGGIYMVAVMTMEMMEVVVMVVSLVV